MKSYLEQAFGRGDVTSARMQAAIREWLNLYYGTQSPGEDAADRLAVLVVSKLCRTVFAEYESRTAEALAPSLQALDAVRVQAMQYALVGGECLLKPVLHGRGFDFVPIRRDCYAPLGRDAHGALTGVGTMEVLRHDGRGYLLLERRTAGADGLTIETRLFELAGEALGREVPLATLPATAQLQPSLLLPGVRVSPGWNTRCGRSLKTVLPVCLPRRTCYGRMAMAAAPCRMIFSSACRMTPPTWG